ncbi:MAG TPA: polyprenyl synthetase family protein [bacterium]|nr:polyprenyl synthetase family protein [bacterium]
MDLTGIYAPIQGDLDALDALLREELASDDPFIGELVQYVLGTRGKLIRPALVCLSAQAAGGAGEARLWIAAAVELIHIASLIHDDIIDESSLRRGSATINAQWGNQIAVLLGDYLFAKAFDLISRARTTAVASAIAHAAVKMSQAEIMQIKYGGDPHDSEAVYFQIIAGKTAHLFSAACRAGALVAGNEEAAGRLADYGLAWGMAFQITDDTLDLTSEPAALGKPIRSDVSGGKVTLPVIHTLRSAPPDDRARLVAALGAPRRDGQLAELDGLLRSYGGVAYALDVARRYSIQATASLEGLTDGPARRSLLELTTFVTSRTS